LLAQTEPCIEARRQPGHSATCPGRRFKSCRPDQYFRLDNLPRKPLWEGPGNEQCLQENQSCPSGPIFTAPIHNRVTSGSAHGRARRFSGWTQTSQPRLSLQSGAEESAPRQSPRQFGTDRDARTRRGAAHPDKSSAILYRVRPKLPPGFIQPCLPSSADKPPTGVTALQEINSTASA
jgi:hypothetical protein